MSKSLPEKIIHWLELSPDVKVHIHFGRFVNSFVAETKNGLAVVGWRKPESVLAQIFLNGRTLKA